MNIDDEIEGQEIETRLGYDLSTVQHVPSRAHPGTKHGAMCRSLVM